jgi:anti-sigma factor RsiW
MDCNETRPLLGADVDRELSANDALRIRQHVEGCAACRAERDRLVALGRAVRQGEYHRAPDALRARIVAGLPPTAGEPSGTRWFERFGLRRAPSGPAVDWPRPRAVALPGLGWIVALVVALAAAAGLTLIAHRSATDRAVDEIVASHVRAGLSTRDVDVISTDRHTVKPWFNGRLDYAPPVEDLSASGFALAGGRLDYVGQRRVAVLVYHYRQHVIDVYVRPTAEGGPSAPYATVSQGYALDRWDAAGMTWWAVTDAEPYALAAFKAALNARLGAPRIE